MNILEDSDTPSSIKDFFDLQSFIIKDESPEGEYEAVRLSQARSSLYLDMPFFGYILGNLEIYPTDDLNIPSYACDTRKIYINKIYTSDKSKEQLKGVLMHLVVHLIMQHGKRKQNRNTDIWGLGADISTRLIVDDARNQLFQTHNFFGNVQTRSIDNIWEIEDAETIPGFLKDRSADNVYKVLNDYAESLEGIDSEEKDDENTNSIQPEIKWRSKKDPKILEEVLEYSGITDPCGFGYAMDVFAQEADEGTKNLEDNRFKGIIRNGISQSRDIGNIPSSILEAINHLIDPKIPWYVLLSQYIQKAVISDWNWVRPNKRMMGMDIILPSTIKENLEIIVAVDTSGSISSDELRDFTAETHSIITSMATVKMTLIDCDADIQQVVEVENGQSIDGTKLPWEGRPWKGRGGTSFIPVFQWVENESVTPDLLIYFTDGYGPFPSDEPPYPVVWVMTTDIIPPFGEVVEYNI